VNAPKRLDQPALKPPNVNEVALRLFVALYKPDTGRTAEHWAEKAFEAADVFVSVAKARQG
jgi:hypothetical protein